MKRRCTLALGISLVVSATTAWADPLPSEIIKFEQLPMLVTEIEGDPYFGHDEFSWADVSPGDPPTNFYFASSWMADDFADTVDADIVHIEWWGSYLGTDEIPATPPLFLIEFLSDRPDGDGPATNDYSRPEFILDAQVLFFDPGPGHPPPGYYTETLEIPSSPTEPVYRYNAHLKNPFPQQSNTVYWLKIVALNDAFGFAPFAWGWHSRDYTIPNDYASPDVTPGEYIEKTLIGGTNVWHFQDDAVMGLDGLQLELNLITCEILFLNEDPTNSAPASYTLFDGPPEITNCSKDLAFRLFYQEPPPELCTKWHQPPDCDIGLDVLSWDLTNGINVGPIVADDFVSDGRPIDGIRWWGSYFDHETMVSNPSAPPFFERPVAFRLTWYSDTPEGGGESFSRPNVVLDTKVLPLDTFNNPLSSGFVQEQHFCVSDLSPFVGPSTNYEHEYQYTVIFTNGAWKEKNANVYWLSVEAIYTNVPTLSPWGWVTTPVDWNWNDDAVYITNGTVLTNEMIYPPPGWESIADHPNDGLSVNMAFELLTEICPARCEKWSQLPDMQFGDDMPSWTYTNFPPGQPLRATDFISDGRPITDIHWWGSYINYKTNVHGDGITNPIAPPSDPTNRPTGFILSWHLSTPSSCVPTTELKQIFVDIDDTHETYFGPVAQFWKGTPSYEHEYQYYVDLLDPDIGDGPWLETNSVHYWLNIQAVFDTTFVPDEGSPHFGWGWKSHSPFTASICGSVVSTNNGLTWKTALFPVGHPFAFVAFDLAFELTTTNIPNTNSFIYVAPTITNITVGAISPPPFKIVSTGYCGCGVQVLQRSLYEDGDLRGSASWIDVMTNLYPRQENVWRHGSLSTQQFYRIDKRH